MGIDAPRKAARDAWKKAHSSSPDDSIKQNAGSEPGGFHGFGSSSQPVQETWTDKPIRHETRHNEVADLEAASEVFPPKVRRITSLRQIYKAYKQITNGELNMQNKKTTLTGIAAVLTAIGGILTAIANGNTDLSTLLPLIAAGASGVGCLFAKDGGA